MNPFYFSANAQLPGHAHQIIHVALHQLPVLIRRQIDHHHIICLFKNAIIPDDLLRVHQRFVCIRIGIKPTELLAGTDRLLYVPADFDTREKALSGAKAAEKGLK